MPRAFDNPLPSNCSLWFLLVPCALASYLGAGYVGEGLPSFTVHLSSGELFG